MRSAGLMGDAAVYMTILYCLAFAPFLLPAAIDVGDLTATPYEVMRVLVITASLARLGGSGHVVLGSFQWSKVGETRGFGYHDGLDGSLSDSGAFQQVTEFHSVR